MKGTVPKRLDICYDFGTFTPFSTFKTCGKTTKIGWYFIYINVNGSPYFGVSILVTTQTQPLEFRQSPAILDEYLRIAVSSDETTMFFAINSFVPQYEIIFIRTLCFCLYILLFLFFFLPFFFCTGSFNLPLYPYKYM